MVTDEVFVLKKVSVWQRRAGAILPVVVIVPFSVAIGLDPSKTQPLHLILTSGIGVACAGIVSALGWYASKRSNEQAECVSLTLQDKMLTWHSEVGLIDVQFADIVEVVPIKRWSSIQQIDIKINNRQPIRITGFDDMDRLAEILLRRTTNDT